MLQTAPTKSPKSSRASTPTRKASRTHQFGFEPMADVFGPTPLKAGDVQIDTFTLDQPPLRSAWHPEEYIEPGTYARLRIGGAVVMSDTRNEQMTNAEVVRQARGKVLIAGLGLGMILVPILKKADVDTVIVVERNPNVIALVEPALRKYVGIAEHREKLVVVRGDIFTWQPATAWPKENWRRKLNVIYFDIWTDQSTDELKVMKDLETKFRPYLAPKGYINSWGKETLKAYQRNRGW
jgi:hypothetical protein